MLDKSLPKSLKSHCFLRVPAREKVWAVHAKISQMPLDKLRWQFTLPFWRHGKKKYALTPREVLNNPRRYRYHYRRILAADLKYPLDIARNQHGKWEILDGLHRLAKAELLGMKKIKVRIISSQQFKKLL